MVLLLSMRTACWSIAVNDAPKTLTVAFETAFKAYFCCSLFWSIEWGKKRYEEKVTMSDCLDWLGVMQHAFRHAQCKTLGRMLQHTVKLIANFALWIAQDLLTIKPLTIPLAKKASDYWRVEGSVWFAGITLWVASGPNVQLRKAWIWTALLWCEGVVERSSVRLWAGSHGPWSSGSSSNSSMWRWLWHNNFVQLPLWWMWQSHTHGSGMTSSLYRV